MPRIAGAMGTCVSCRRRNGVIEKGVDSDGASGSFEEVRADSRTSEKLLPLLDALRCSRAQLKVAFAGCIGVSPGERPEVLREAARRVFNENPLLKKALRGSRPRQSAQSIVELYALAEEAKPKLAKALALAVEPFNRTVTLGACAHTLLRHGVATGGLSRTSQVVSGVVTPRFRATVAAYKPRIRAWEKAAEDYGDGNSGAPVSFLCDILRAEVVCSKGVVDVSTIFIAIDDAVRRVGGRVVRCKNRFLSPSFTGYRDVLLHVVLPCNHGSSFIAEVQIHDKGLLDKSRELGSQRVYEAFRTYFRREDSAATTAVKISVAERMSAIVERLGTSSLTSAVVAALADPSWDEIALRSLFQLLFAGQDFYSALSVARRLAQLARARERPLSLSYGLLQEAKALLALKAQLSLAAMRADEASRIRRDQIGDSIDTAEALMAAGDAFRGALMADSALERYREAAEVYERVNGAEHLNVSTALQAAALISIDSGNEDDGRRLLIRALPVCRRYRPEAAAHALFRLGCISEGEERVALMEEALDLLSTHFGREHPRTKEHACALETLHDLGPMTFWETPVTEGEALRGSLIWLPGSRASTRAYSISTSGGESLAGEKIYLDAKDSARQPQAGTASRVLPFIMT